VQSEELFQLSFFIFRPGSCDSLLVPSLGCCPLVRHLVGVGLSSTNGRSAALQPARPQCVFCGRPVGTTARAWHGGARATQGGDAAVHRQVGGSVCGHLPPAGDTHGASTWTGALQYLLRAVPRSPRHRRRYDRTPRLSPSSVLPPRAAACGASWLLLRCDYPGLWRDAGLRRANTTAGPLGHYRLHSCSATEPACNPRRGASSGAGETRSMT